MTSIDIETEELNNKEAKLQRRASMRDKVNETVEKSWRSVKTGLGKILETRITNSLVVILLFMDVCIVVGDLLVKLYKREYPEYITQLTKTDDILYWVIFGLRTFYLFMIIVRVSSYGFIYLADPLNLFDAFIVIIAAIFYYVFREKDRVIACLFILCRFWRINRVLEFTEQKKKDKHQENYERLQRRLTTRLESERNINSQLRKELEENDQSLNILMGGDLVTSQSDMKRQPSKGVKFADEQNKNKNKKDNNNDSQEFSYVSEFESYFSF